MAYAPAVLRTPATPSWLILTPFRARAASAMALSGRPCARKTAISRIPSCSAWWGDELAVIAPPVAERNRAAEIAARSPLVLLHLRDALADPIALSDAKMHHAAVRQKSFLRQSNTLNQ
jgi:hypothetical protein